MNGKGDTPRPLSISQNQFSDNWEKIFIIIIVVQNFVKGLRDALDTTPETDDNILEKICSISNKILGYMIGFRSKKPVA